MSFEAQCPQCMFVSRQLPQPTPCLLHVSPDFEAKQASVCGADHDEPYEFGRMQLTVDRPGPFSLREYVRLRLLRGRLEAARALLDGTSPPTRAGSLSRT